MGTRHLIRGQQPPDTDTFKRWEPSSCRTSLDAGMNKWYWRDAGKIRKQYKERELLLNLSCLLISFMPWFIKIACDLGYIYLLKWEFSSFLEVCMEFYLQYSSCEKNSNVLLMTISVNIMWFVYAVEYNSVMKNEILPFAAIWIHLKSIIPSEVSQIKTNTWYHLYVESKK